MRLLVIVSVFFVAPFCAMEQKPLSSVILENHPYLKICGICKGENAEGKDRVFWPAIDGNDTCISYCAHSQCSACIAPATIEFLNAATKVHAHNDDALTTAVAQLNGCLQLGCAALKFSSIWAYLQKNGIEDLKVLCAGMTAGFLQSSKKD